MDFGDEEGAEAGVAVAEGGEEEEELVEVVGWGGGEGVCGWGGDGEDVGEGVGYVEEFLDLGGLVRGVDLMGWGRTSATPWTSMECGEKPAVMAMRSLEISTGYWNVMLGLSLPLLTHPFEMPSCQTTLRSHCWLTRSSAAWDSVLLR